MQIKITMFWHVVAGTKSGLAYFQSYKPASVVIYFRRLELQLFWWEGRQCGFLNLALCRLQPFGVGIKALPIKVWTEVVQVTRQRGCPIKCGRLVFLHFLGLWSNNGRQNLDLFFVNALSSPCLGYSLSKLCCSREAFPVQQERFHVLIPGSELSCNVRLVCEGGISTLENACAKAVAECWLQRVLFYAY